MLWIKIPIYGHLPTFLQPSYQINQFTSCFNTTRRIVCHLKLHYSDNLHICITCDQLTVQCDNCGPVTVFEMLSLVNKSVKDPSVLRRLQFASVFLKREFPKYADILMSFALKGKENRNPLNSEQAKRI